MTKKNWLILALAVLVSLAALAVACGGGDDDDDSGGDDDNSDDDAGEGEPGFLNGFVRDFQTKTPVNNALVEALDDETGESFDPPITTTTGTSAGN